MERGLTLSGARRKGAKKKKIKRATLAKTKRRRVSRLISRATRTRLILACARAQTGCAFFSFAASFFLFLFLFFCSLCFARLIGAVRVYGARRLGDNLRGVKDFYLQVEQPRRNAILSPTLIYFNYPAGARHFFLSFLFRNMQTY